MTKKIYILGILLLFGYFVNAQQDTNKNKVGQFTFSYPLGTNGLTSFNYSNSFSINTLVGLNGGVNGIEFGGLANLNNGAVYGAQFGGLLNATNGNIFGEQFGGLANINNGDFFGAQFAGLLNINIGDASGIQTAGLINFNKGNVNHIQIAGLLNANYGNANGLQIAGLINSNLNLPQKTENFLVQISGIANQNATKMNGLQLSGILNISIDSLLGSQIGLINLGSNVSGVQIGLINICTKNSPTLLPIGLLNFVKGGLFEFEFAAGDLIYSNFNYKMGVNKFYTIYKLGYTIYNKKQIYTYGLGLGTYLNLNEKNRLSLEISSSNITNNWLIFTSFDLLNKIDLNFKHDLTEHFSVFLGPSFNIYLSDSWGISQEPMLKPLYTIANNTSEYYGINIYNWIGLNAGISFKL